MKAFSGSEEAFTGLEAAIVLIAFVVVAAVFSYVVLGAGFFTTQKSQQVVHSGVQAASSNIEILGDVYGRGSGTSSIVGINFTIGLAAGGTPVDMQRITLVMANSSSRYELTQFVPATGMTGGTPQAGFWTVVGVYNGDQSTMLETGEQADISVALPATNYIVKNDVFNLEIQPDVGAALGIKRKGPSAIDAFQRLY